MAAHVIRAAGGQMHHRTVVPEHQQHFRVTSELELVQHMDLQAAESAAEIDLLLRRNALVAEDQYVMVQMSAPNPEAGGWRSGIGCWRWAATESDTR